MLNFCKMVINISKPLCSYNFASYSFEALSNGFFKSPLTPRKSPFKKLSRGNMMMLFKFCIYDRYTTTSNKLIQTNDIKL